MFTDYTKTWERMNRMEPIFYFTIKLLIIALILVTVGGTMEWINSL